VLAQEGWTVKNLDKAYKDGLAARQRAVDDLLDFNNTLVEFDQLFESLAVLNKARLSMTYYGISVTIDVDKMEDITPALELIEDVTGITFDRTSDYADDWGAMRTFSSKTVSWINVIAYVKSEATGCRSVIAGYEQTPIYKIECGEPA
jgi:hypothetical protein